MLKYTDIGLDLGSYSLKVSAYIPGSNDYYINQEYLIKSVSKFGDKYFEEIRIHLDSFIKENKIKMYSLNISLPNNLTSHIKVGHTDLPTDKKNIIQKAIGYEIQEEMNATSLNGFEYVWEIINDYEDDDGITNNEMIYNVLSKEIIEELKKFTTVKSKIRSVFIQPVAIKENINDNSIVIDFGYKDTRVYMFEFGVLKNIETIDFGGVNIDEIIETTSGFNHEDDIFAIKQKCYMANSQDDENYLNYEEEDEEDEEYGYEDKYKESLYTDDEDMDEEELLIDGYSEDNDEHIESYDQRLIYNCSSAITKEFTNVIGRIKQTIRSFELTNDVFFENLYIMGGVAQIEDLCDVLSDEFSLNAIPLIEYEEFKHLKLLQVENEFLVSAYLANIPKDKQLKELNFNKFTKFSIDVVPILLGILCMTVIVNFTAYKLNKNYNDEISSLESTLSSLSQELNQQEQLTEEARGNIREVEALASSSGRLEIQKKWLSDVFGVLKKVTPSELVISKVDSKSNTIVLSGYAKDYADIGFLGLSLEDYGEVTINQITKSDETKYIVTEKEDEDDLQMKQEFQILLVYEDLLVKEGNKLPDAGK